LAYPIPFDTELCKVLAVIARYERIKLEQAPS
jgi:hypothetical protein